MELLFFCVFFLFFYIYNTALHIIITDTCVYTLLRKETVAMCCDNGFSRQGVCVQMYFSGGPFDRGRFGFLGFWMFGLFMLVSILKKKKKKKVFCLKKKKIKKNMHCVNIFVVSAILHLSN